MGCQGFGRGDEASKWGGWVGLGGCAGSSACSRSPASALGQPCQPPALPAPSPAHHYLRVLNITQPWEQTLLHIAHRVHPIPQPPETPFSGGWRYPSAFSTQRCLQLAQGAWECWGSLMGAALVHPNTPMQSRAGAQGSHMVTGPPKVSELPPPLPTGSVEPKTPHPGLNWCFS